MLLTGKQFHMLIETLGIETVDDKPVTTKIPKGALIRVVSGPKPTAPSMVDVEWNGKLVLMFADDITTRGEEVNE